MSGSTAPRPPLWFWLLSGLFLLWGLAGSLACYMQLTISEAGLAALPSAQRDAWLALTFLPKAAYVVAVAAGVLGSVLLLTRKRLARSLFFLSLAGIIIQFGWFFGVYGGLAKLGPSSVVFPAFIFLVALAEIWFAGLSARRGWVR